MTTAPVLDVETRRKVWLKSYEPGTPHSLAPYPQSTLLDIFHEAVSQRPESPALLFKGAKMSNAELERLSTAFAQVLLEFGVKPGDRVALVMPNSPQEVLCLLGTWKVGAIAVPLNPLYTEHELEFALNECRAETVVVLTAFYDKVKNLVGRTKLQHVIATNVKEYIPAHLRVLFTLFKEKKEGHRVKLAAGHFWLSDLLKKHANSKAPLPEVHPRDPALLLFTGGTTGTPKGALGLHEALVCSGMQLNAWSKSLLMPWDDVIMLNMPLFHTYGMAGVFSVGIVGHNPLALVPNPRDLGDLLDTIEKVKPAFLPAVPTLFNALLNHDRVKTGKTSLKCLKLSFSGASALMLETKQRFEAATGGRIIEGYSLTEACMATIATPVMGTYKPGSIGLPLPDVEARIVDSENGVEELAPGEVGEIQMRAPQLMQGFWEKPRETMDIIRDGWLYTGDLGYMDEDGYIFIVDRKKDVIKPSGFQVWPREVEEVLATHPAVLEVGVAGVPDPYQVEAVKAWVVLRPGQAVTVDELRAFCRKTLAPYKVPKHIEFTESLPKSQIGKILRRELVRQHKEAMAD